MVPCYHPVIAYRSRQGRNPETGLWPIVFNVSDGYKDLEVVVPCGRCIGCRLEKSRQWAMRCVHESSMYSKNVFITLTYDETHRPPDNSLNKKDICLFLKRLRKKYGKFRYYQCGEYGERFSRPHHHACLFGIDFPDKELWSIREGVKLYRSVSLQRIWKKGYVTIGDVTFESAAYVARYVMKKITGENAEKHYEGRLPEFVTMSRRPGIGRQWWDKYKSDVLVKDKVIMRDGIMLRPPRYYDNIYDKENHADMERRKAKRRLKINEEEGSAERLAVREKVKLLKLKQLKRSLENGTQNVFDPR